MSTDKSIEKTYQKKTQLEHILLRPDTYIGSNEVDSTELWVLREGEDKFSYDKIDYVPGLYKIFDEILVNAADNYQRDSNMDTISVTINKAKNLISVWNNGNGIPIQIHKDYNIYVPELIFGHLLTSSNYDDTAKKVTGGRNGFGAKLTNIFSKKFTVETADRKTKKQFKMVWKDNMSHCSPPEIKDNYKGEDYTCITFEPDLSRFGMKELNDDIVALMRKRVCIFSILSITIISKFLLYFTYSPENLFLNLLSRYTISLVSFPPLSESILMTRRSLLRAFHNTLICISTRIANMSH